MPNVKGNARSMILSTIQIGSEIPEEKKVITQENIMLYARASRDFNPIHIDEEFAKETPLGGTVAHGMLILSYISELMTESFGKEWVSGGKLNVRFKAPARPGDIITVSGKVRKIEKLEGNTVINCEVLCANQRGDTVISGESIVRVKNNENLC
jgi:3-hydroxybutyryl-CoA dehydratase